MSTKVSKASKAYLLPDGTTVQHARADAVALVISFVNGETLTVDTANLRDDMLRCAALHGLSQKLGDSYAGAETVEDAFESASALWEAMCGEDGSWLQRGESAGPRVTVLAEAVCRAKPEKYADIAAATAMLAEKDKAGKAAIAAIPQVAAAMAAIKAERAAKAAEKAAKAAAGADGDEAALADL